ncbi:hypothetical protein CEUSTIGMA_g4941.t1 [Chlamydomonas eustigma]|uniref:Uncharacterized protein n=1 Tax=Chlamydomonas eustigma TaxID=1157962 RepID=A0A250X350_9CHLO|nr:hypothetical protein CEUSTIGMA_g4941.t1 [Chlamydomonas eustigma]|eukprot:GAX77497.1 hypothetical protein CEUSTIGMA_g4941.t1 [Chlamydomonas eustigma]
MTAKAATKIGFDESEQKEFNKALKQQLLVQTPLQVLLETLFSRLQSQAQLFNDLQRRVERIEARDIDGQELLRRVQLCEGRLNEFKESKLSPFNQQEIMSRLAEVEDQVKQASEKELQIPTTIPPGRILGSNQSTVGDGAAAAAATAAAAAAGQAAGQAAGLSAAHFSNFFPQHPGLMQYAGAAGADGRDGLSADPRLEGRVTELEEKLKCVYNLCGKLVAVENIASELGVDIPDLQYAPGAPGSEASSSNMASTGPHSRSQSNTPKSQTRSTGVVDRRGEKPKSSGNLVVVGRKPGTSLGGGGGDHDGGRHALGSGLGLGEIKNNIQKIIGDNEALKLTVETIKNSLGGQLLDVTATADSASQRIGVLETSFNKFKGEVGHDMSMGEAGHDMSMIKSHSKREAEVSYADFSKLQSQVEAAVQEVKGMETVVSAVKEGDIKSLQASIGDMQTAINKSNEPREIDKLFHQRISTVEAKLDGIGNEVKLAVSDLMEDLVTLNDLENLNRELEAKASSEDLKLLAQQQAGLASSVNGITGWLAVRPEANDGSKGTAGAVFTKFKCLTCDREIKAQTGPTGNSVLKGSFLPKLDAMQGHQHHSTGPNGPGLNAGRPRSPPITGADIEGYAAESRNTSPNRTTRTPNGRVAINLPSGGMRLPAGPRTTPVFI